mmetsp:Transcript_29443/g.48616  ORF Transcript_29443/g.48616 Transcript_29443/m.48616 type:complete len:265 (+) Transcript_29443:2-796(+)
MPKDVPKAVLRAVTLWALMADTPGALASGLKVKNNSRQRVLGYIVLTVVVPALNRLLNDWYYRVSTSSTQGDINESNPQTNPLEIRARDRRRRLAKKLIDLVSRCDPVIRFTVLMSWWAGKVSAPTPEMCMTDLSFVATSHPQDLNVSYAHRRWTYEAFLRTIQLMSPVQSLQDAKALVCHFLNPVLTVCTRLFRQQSVTRCALCNTHPVVPYITDCDHLYCYTCLFVAMAQDSSFRCQYCGQHVRSSRPKERDRRLPVQEIVA